jgi:hypothetical protein
MPRLRNRFTGSVVNVPEEKVAGLNARGFDSMDDAKKAPAKKAASSKSSSKK